MKVGSQSTITIAQMQAIDTDPNQMQLFFNAAMKRFLGEQKIADQDTSRQPRSQPAPVIPNIPDVEMESVGSHHSQFDMELVGSRHSQAEEYDQMICGLPSLDVPKWQWQNQVRTREQ